MFATWLDPERRVVECLLKAMDKSMWSRQG